MKKKLRLRRETIQILERAARQVAGGDNQDPFTITLEPTGRSCGCLSQEPGVVCTTN